MAYFRKRSNGWEYRISYKAPDGSYKQKSKSGFRTKSEAVQSASKAEIELDSGLIADKNISLYAYFKQWMDVHKKPNVSLTTYKAYVHTSRKIKLFFGDRKLSEINPTIYQRVINEYAQTYAQDTIERFNIHIKACVKMAVHEGYIAKNFCEFVTINAKNKGRALETKFLEVNEYLEVIKVSYQKRHYPSYAVIYLIAKTGLRFSECLGLTVNDIDFEQATLSVNKTWDYKYSTGFLPTKNESSKRDIPLDPETLEFLKELAESKKDRLFDKISNNAANKSLRAIVKREVRIHSLRHTYASYLISKSVDLISISQVLGHENLNITLEVYAHQLQEQKNRNDDKIKKFGARLGRNLDNALFTRCFDLPCRNRTSNYSLGGSCYIH